MSYILDALKKANAEREHERGTPPGLHTRPVRAVSDSAAQTGGAVNKSNVLLLALVAALMLCMATIGALFWSPPKPPAAMPSSSSPTLQLPASQQSTTTTAPNAPQVNTAAAASAVGTATQLVTPVRVTPAPNNLPSLAVQAQPQSPAVRQKSATAQTAQTTPPPLPASVRAALPPLAISGSTYSDNPAHRMLIINGQVYREGDSPTPELKLEQIRPKSAVLNYKGSTYVLNY